MAPSASTPDWATALLNAHVEPLSPDPAAVSAWFGLFDVLAAYPEGLSSRQLARRLGLEASQNALTRTLERLAERNELIRVQKGAVRFVAKSLDKLLPDVLGQLPGRLPGPERAAFDQAAFAYMESPRSAEWKALVAALLTLVAAIPGWPPATHALATADPAEWLRRTLGLEPPSYLLGEFDPLVVSLRAEIARLKVENEALAQRLARAEAAPMTEGGKKADFKARAEQLEAENGELTQRLAELESVLTAVPAPGDRPALVSFLEGVGPGELPATLPPAEVARLRELVAATKASRPIQLALAAGLSAIYRAPTATQRLTTAGFKDHPFDSLWRLRVGSYRIVYGLKAHQVYPIAIDTRGDVYGDVVHALKARHWPANLGR